MFSRNSRVDHILIDEAHYLQRLHVHFLLTCVGRGLRRREVFQRRCSGRSARHKSRLQSSVRWGRLVVSSTNRATVDRTSDAASRQLPQPLQLPPRPPSTRNAGAWLRARNARRFSIQPPHFIQSWNVVRFHFQLGGQVPMLTTSSGPNWQLSTFRSDNGPATQSARMINLLHVLPLEPARIVRAAEPLPRSGAHAIRSLDDRFAAHCNSRNRASPS